jgi:hypothetical protein
MTQSNPNEQNVEFNCISLYWGLLLRSPGPIRGRQRKGCLDLQKGRLNLQNFCLNLRKDCLDLVKVCLDLRKGCFELRKGCLDVYIYLFLI